MERKLITNSSTGCFKSCRKRYQWSYVLGIRPEYDGRALRMGSATHDGLDVFRVTGDVDHALYAARKHYEHCPEQFNLHDWEIERETVAALVNGYAWRWGDANLHVSASEQSFQIRLVNPATDSPSTSFDLAGKIDGIVRLEDGRLAVLESKTVSEDIAWDSDYWTRLQLDGQPTIYMIGARGINYDVATVLWDAIRKPTIKPTAVAVVDDLGAKIVLDAQGNRVKTERGQWRQTGDTAKGYVLQQRDMTPDEWSKKLTTDIGERPDYYFQRREIPRLDSEIEECRAELWDLQKTIKAAENEGRWFRTVAHNTCGTCPYWALCSSKYNPADTLPAGFIVVQDLHPELKEDTDGITT